MPLTRAKRLAGRIVSVPKLPLALTGAVVIALILTAVSVSWYTLDGSSKLDLSRPGYERERIEVRTTDTLKTYDTTSPVDQGTFDTFLKEFDDRSKELNGYGSFGDGALDDNDIQLQMQTGGNSSAQ